MKKVLFVLGMFMLLIPNVKAATITACEGGTCDYDNLQQAIDMASNGDTILVKSNILYSKTYLKDTIENIQNAISAKISAGETYDMNDYVNCASKTVTIPENKVLTITGEKPYIIEGIKEENVQLETISKVEGQIVYHMTPCMAQTGSFISTIKTHSSLTINNLMFSDFPGH